VRKISASRFLSIRCMSFREFQFCLDSLSSQEWNDSDFVYRSGRSRLSLPRWTEAISSFQGLKTTLRTALSNHSRELGILNDCLPEESPSTVINRMIETMEDVNRAPGYSLSPTHADGLSHGSTSALEGTLQSVNASFDSDGY
jgi:hypothetical protein